MLRQQPRIHVIKHECAPTSHLAPPLNADFNPLPCVVLVVNTVLWNGSEQFGAVPEVHAKWGPGAHAAVPAVPAEQLPLFTHSPAPRLPNTAVA